MWKSRAPGFLPVAKWDFWGEKTIWSKDYWKYARCVIAKLQLSGENSCWLRPTCLETSQWYLVISQFFGMSQLWEGHSLTAHRGSRRRSWPPRSSGKGFHHRAGVATKVGSRCCFGFEITRFPLDLLGEIIIKPCNVTFWLARILKSEDKGPTRGAFYWCHLSADQLEFHCLRRWHWCDLGFPAGWDIPNFATYSPFL